MSLPDGRQTFSGRATRGGASEPAAAWRTFSARSTAAPAAAGLAPGAPPPPGPAPGPLDLDLELLDVLGEGGAALVRRARDRALDRVVAVKQSRRAGDPAAASFLGEALVTASLQHPGIVPIYGLAAGAQGDALLAMKLVGGRPWSALLAEERERDDLAAEPFLERHLGIFLRACDVVAFAHAGGVIHRDLKPENVMVGELTIRLVEGGGGRWAPAAKARVPFPTTARSP